MPENKRSHGVAQGLTLFGFAVCSLALLIECGRYLALDFYLDHIEPNVAISGWEYLRGVPLYEMQDGAPHFANLYGPLASLAEAPAFLALGPSVVASKITAILALLATIVVMWRWLSQKRTPQTADAMLFMVAAFTAMSPWSFWARADPIETLLVAVGIATVGYPAIAGVCVGLAVNCKVHAFVYFLPILFEIYTRSGWKGLFLLVIFSGFTFLSPFLLPGISIHDYMVTVAIHVAGRSPTSEGLSSWFGYALILSLPVAFPLIQGNGAKPDRVFAITAFASLGLLLYLSTYPGAGPYHLLPLIPVLVAARHRLPSGTPVTRAALLPVVMVAFTTAHFCLDRMASGSASGALADEAVELTRNSPVQPAELGYGETEPSYKVIQLAKAKLAFLGKPPAVDAQVLMELRKSGIDGSQRWVRYVSECEIRRWIIPKDEKPFTTGSYYDDVRLFNASFRQKFAARYHVVATSGHYQIWECESDPG